MLYSPEPSSRLLTIADRRLALKVSHLVHFPGVAQASTSKTLVPLSMKGYVSPPHGISQKTPKVSFPGVNVLLVAQRVPQKSRSLEGTLQMYSPARAATQRSEAMDFGAYQPTAGGDGGGGGGGGSGAMSEQFTPPKPASHWQCSGPSDGNAQ